MSRWMVGRSAESGVEDGEVDRRKLSGGGASAASRGFFRTRAVGVALVVACVVLYGAAGALLFAPSSAGWKAGAVSVLVVAAEGCFWVAAVVLGREVVRRYRRFFNPFNWFDAKGIKQTGAPAGAEGGAEAESAGRMDRTGWQGWRVFGVLVVVTTVGSSAVVPYASGLLGQGGSPEVSAWVLLVAQVVQGLLFTAIAAGLGLWLGPKVGLGAPDLRAVVAGENGGWHRVKTAMPLAVGLGTASGVVFLAANLVSAPLMPASFAGAMEGLEMPPAWQGLLASFGAGITEEVWLRLGLMTALVALGARLLRQGSRPAPSVVWAAILISTLAFGALHLPQMAALGGGLTAFSVAFVLAGNGALGVVFGWLYWRRGLIAAVAAHVAFDVVTKVIVPLFA